MTMDFVTHLFLFTTCIAFFYRRLFNVTSNVFGCGLAGFCGDRKPNIAKMKILGLYNQKRGHDSNGMYYNGEITKAIGPMKEYDKFIESDDGIIVDARLKSNVMLIHCRAASVGIVDEENCHPHKVNNKVLVHNGTIHNIWDLCNKYEVDHKGIHSDSLALTHLLDKVGPKILNEYKGFATILACDTDDPSTLWCYHGASKEYAYESAPLVEERPLFYMKTEEGIYLSSLEESLNAIRDRKDQVPIKVEVNKLIKIKGSNYEEEVIPIHRESNNVGFTYKQTKWKGDYRDEGYGGMGFTRGGACIVPPKKDATKPLTLPFPVAYKKTIGKDCIDICNENMPVSMQELSKTESQFILFLQGRYYDDQGKLAEGQFLVDSKGLIVASTLEAKGKVTTACFYRGILIKTTAQYLVIQDAMEFPGKTTENYRIAVPTHGNFAKTISEYSRYPVSTIEGESTKLNDGERLMWYKDGMLAKGGFTPLFSVRNYTWKDGLLTAIESKDKKDVIFQKKSETPSVDKGEDEALNSMVNSLLKTYISKKEVMDKVPNTVFTAFRMYYATDYESQTYLSQIDKDKLIDEDINSHISKCVSNNKPLIHGMERSMPPMSHYIRVAYIQEKADLAADSTSGFAVGENGEIFPMETISDDLGGELSRAINNVELTLRKNKYGITTIHTKKVS